jgi:hypothetical protein
MRAVIFLGYVPPVHWFAYRPFFPPAPAPVPLPARACFDARITRSGHAVVRRQRAEIRLRQRFLSTER